MMYQIAIQPIPTEEVRTARKEVLDWEKNNRTSLNRAVSKTACLWQATETSPGCAVGRLCTPAQQKVLAEMLPGDDPFFLLPDNVKKLGKPFLRHIQDLHDSSENWNEKGLSSNGLKVWNEIHRAFVFAV